ncbi:GGDEF domain-containing protein [Companilactobacillus kimchii]|uniref:Diguanylate cyclase n=2 Tax=Companilactobacillus kimchii TaxID=2801452 RepID=A0A210P9Z4_9LACO|nr:GGDEF domain-containing protein [Companilactobacillus kimchii]OWF33319.1 Diguanylate cyclase [Companilactobacillus kimchii]GEO46398.1 GGDEF domain-containing protein [Companilactobacillus paralimentarius]
MLTKIFLDNAPLITSLFFIMGAFIVFQILFAGVRLIFKVIHRNIDKYLIRSILGIIYILSLLFIMQLSIRDKNQSWIYINFQLVSIIFYTVILSVPFKYHLFGPIVVAFMIFNSALNSWESWCSGIVLISFYYSLNYIKSHTKNKFPFFPYLLVSLILGSAYWFLIKIKFSISNPIFFRQVIYLFIIELFTFGYIAILYTDLESRAALFRDATHDKLTQAYNYDAFDIDFRSLFKDNVISDGKFTMMMFDIDHFKSINDTYGHLAGNKVLQTVVEVVQSVLAKNDKSIKLYRTGGEEFNIIFPHYHVKETQTIVKEIFEAVNHTEVDVDKNKIHITISVGVSEISKKDVSVNDFYSRVDKALYHSKRNGRKEITII